MSTTLVKEKPKTEKQNQKDIGRMGEDAAVQYLEQNAYQILERNWTCSAGEADIIAKGEGALSFIEVKTRKSYKAGLPEEAVTSAKRKRYEKIAILYLAKFDGGDCKVRFDVISVNVISGTKAFLRHHKDAFACE